MQTRDALFSHPSLLARVSNLNVHTTSTFLSQGPTATGMEFQRLHFCHAGLPKDLAFGEAHLHGFFGSREKKKKDMTGQKGY